MSSGSGRHACGTLVSCRAQHRYRPSTLFRRQSEAMLGSGDDKGQYERDGQGPHDSEPEFPPAVQSDQECDRGFIAELEALAIGTDSPGARAEWAAVEARGHRDVGRASAEREGGTLDPHRRLAAEACDAQHGLPAELPFT